MPLTQLAIVHSRNIAGHPGKAYLESNTGFVDIKVIVFTDCAECLDAYGEFFHGIFLFWNKSKELVCGIPLVY